MNRQAVSIWLAIALAVPAVGQGVEPEPTLIYVGAEKMTSGVDGYEYQENGARFESDGREDVEWWGRLETQHTVRDPNPVSMHGVIEFTCVASDRPGYRGREGAGESGSREDLTLSITITRGDEEFSSAAGFDASCEGAGDTSWCNPAYFDFSGDTMFSNPEHAKDFLNWLSPTGRRFRSAGKIQFSNAGSTVADRVNYEMHFASMRSRPSPASNAEDEDVRKHFGEAARACAEVYGAYASGVSINGPRDQLRVPTGEHYIGPGAR